MSSRTYYAHLFSVLADWPIRDVIERFGQDTVRKLMEWKEQANA